MKQAFGSLMVIFYSNVADININTEQRRKKILSSDKPFFLIKSLFFLGEKKAESELGSGCLQFSQPTQFTFFSYILISVFVVLLVFIFITLFVFVLRRKLSGGCLQFSRPSHLPLYLHNAFIFLPLLQFTFIISKTHKISVVR